MRRPTEPPATLVDATLAAPSRPSAPPATLGLAQTLAKEPGPLRSSPSLVDVAPAPLSESPEQDRYEHRSTLGAGGMGEVRLCRDRRLGREVALKRMHEGSYRQPGVLERFLREVRVQGQLEHPAIVPVYDLGVTPTGEAYFTMKRVRGRTLQEVLDARRRGDPEVEKRYSLRKLLTAFSSVCLALDFAHERGVLHRDLKPANLMLGDFGEVYLLDWGIARVQSGGPVEVPSSPRAGDEENTERGSLLGTPGYMSPEQVEGRHDELDARSDVYALGAILFELLAREPLHRAATITGLLAQTLEGVDARPSARSPTAEVPPELEALCVRATAREPSQRLASARELSDALERYLDGDRDLALRKDLAEKHAAAAAAALEREGPVSKASADARVTALREVGRALALDPEHRGARRALVQLLTEPPAEAPPGALEQLDKAEAHSERVTSAMAAVGFTSWALYTIPFALMGFRHLPLFLATLLCYLTGAGLAFLRARDVVRARRAIMLSVAFSVSLGNALASWFFSPFVFAQTGVVAITMFFMLYPWRGGRVPVVAMGVLSTLVPSVLQHWRVLPAAFEFREGQLHVLPYVLALPSHLTFATLTVIGIGSIVLASTLVALYRDQLARSERKMLLYLWQLQQLAPEEAASAA